MLPSSPDASKPDNRATLEAKAAQLAQSPPHKKFRDFVRLYQNKAIQWLLDKNLDPQKTDKIFSEVFLAFALDSSVPEEREAAQSCFYDIHAKNALISIRRGIQPHPGPPPLPGYPGIPPKKEPFYEGADEEVLDKALEEFFSPKITKELLDKYIFIGNTCAHLFYGILRNMVRKFWWQYHNNKERGKGSATPLPDGSERMFSFTPTFFDQRLLEFSLLLDRLEEIKGYRERCRELLEALYHDDLSIKEYAAIKNAEALAEDKEVLKENSYDQRKSRCLKEAKDFLNSQNSSPKVKR